MKLEIKEEQRTVFTWKCPKCSKKMESLNEAQLRNNARVHYESHEKELIFAA